MSNVVQVKGVSGFMFDRSGTITSGGTSQLLIGANEDRKYLLVQNVSDTTMWIDFKEDAVATQPSVQIVAGASFIMDGTAISQNSINIICATTGKAFTAKEMM